MPYRTQSNGRDRLTTILIPRIEGKALFACSARALGTRPLYAFGMGRQTRSIGLRCEHTDTSLYYGLPLRRAFTPSESAHRDWPQVLVHLQPMRNFEGFVNVLGEPPEV